MPTTTLVGTAVRENLAFVMGAELQRLPVAEADAAFAKLQAGKPQLVATGDTVAVLFADGTPFCSTTVQALLAAPPTVTHHGNSVLLA